ncbi:non-ribosomal peptide synthetase [Plantactinospora sp. KBS50]|uniref:non-ribosomal peptide synthetase n=1 Tax=Plantactinospora sp. KBS50 TaxID=2024580 RepID=UPI0012FE78BE|nr:non-ribosomal peptide synthetase [Plantactinospora sp. KBS50]
MRSADHRSDPGPPEEYEEYEFPVSPAQASLLMLERVHAGSAQYHVPTAFAVRGRLDLDAFAHALDALVARHESLRTVFRTVDGAPRQVVAARARAELHVERDVPAAELAGRLRQAAQRPFDLARGPLLRCTVYAVPGDGYRILLTVHHLVCDGWSVQIMLRELAADYAARLAGGAVDDTAPPVQYPDFAAWQRDRLAAGDYAAAVAHWRDLLAGAPAVLALPTERPRPAVQTTAGGVERFALPTGVRRRLTALAHERGATPFAVLFAAFAAFLYRMAGQPDLVVGFPVSGRDHPDVQGMVGLLTNTLPLRVDVSGRPRFVDLVDRVRDRLRAAGPYQDVPFGAVVDAVAPRRQSSHDPVVQVVFGYDDDTVLELPLPGARVERIDLSLDVAKFDVLLHVERAGDGLVAQLNYRTDLFAAATLRRWAAGFRTLLDGLLDRPDAPVDAVDLLDPAARDRILRDGAGPVTAVPDRPVTELIAERAATQPEATALVCGQTVLRYRELLARADALAAGLTAAGVGPEVPVGLCLSRSAEMAVAALAVLRAGGAYLPLDPRQPPGRLRGMLTGAGARLVLANAPTAERAGDLGVPVAVVAPAADGYLVPPPPAAAVDPARPGGATDPARQAAAVDPAAGTPAGLPAVRAGNLAYLLHTSGSTGTPKGVAITHGALTNLATAVRRHFAVTAADRVLQYVAFSFDVAVSDLVFAWVGGAELHIAGEHERLGDALYDRLAAAGITYAFLPPSAAMSLPCPPGALPELRTLAIGGEACPAELVARWSTPGRTLIDAYGPSEDTVYASTAELSPDRPVRIGRPVANGGAYVLDERLRPVPAGVAGEIYLTGAGLARGYANRPALTAERFVADPFGPPGSRMYRTGDLGRYDADGLLDYLGRTDDQVKIRGFRVELGEIETVLAGHPDVASAAARVLGEADRQRLVGYLVAVPGRAPEPGELRRWLADRLPGYMVPESLVRLDRLPTGRTGKVDRSRLPAPPTDRPDLGPGYAAPDTATQRRLVDLWSRVLGIDGIGVHDNFFELGGNSLRLLTVLTGLREQGDRDLGMVDLLRYPTVAALASRLDAAGVPDPAPADRAAARRRGQDRRARLAARAADARTRTNPEKGGTA